MRIASELTDGAIAQILGERVARHRIEAGLTQAELAERAGIGKRTLERVEAGLGAELVTLIRVLRALNAMAGFERVLPELPPSPIAQLKLRGKQRQRVSHARRSKPDRRGNQATDSVPAGPWRWAEPAPAGEPPARGTRRAQRKS